MTFGMNIVYFLFQDLIIFPDDCEFKRVSQCTTGRVYVLKFKSSNKKFFFWVQASNSFVFLLILLLVASKRLQKWMLTTLENVSSGTQD